MWPKFLAGKKFQELTVCKVKTTGVVAKALTKRHKKTRSVKLNSSGATDFVKNKKSDHRCYNIVSYPGL